MARGKGNWIRLEPQGSWAAGVAALLRALDDPPRRGHVHFEQPLDVDVDPLAWLARRRGGTRVFFESREREAWMAGVGAALQIDGPAPTVLGALSERLAEGEAGQRLRFVTWARFDLHGAPDTHWAAFGVVRASLPRVVLRKDAGGVSLIAHVVASSGAEQEFSLNDAARMAQDILVGDPALVAPHAPPPDAPSTPEREWKDHVRRVLARIGAGTLRKVVLARVRSLTRPAAVSPWRLLAQLRQDYPDTYPFAVQLEDGRAFLGATPERLYRRSGRSLWTEALAGTTLRSAEVHEDARLADALLESPKDRLEHELVRLHLLDRLRPWCHQLDHDDVPEIVRLRNLQHLRTPIRATLRATCSDADLLMALHPTPAVCGLPDGPAMELLRESEDFDRGLYCGPVGWFGRDEADIAVALRSAWVQGQTVRLFAGAGIVQGSDPDAEWNETVAKMRALESVLPACDPTT